MSATETRIVRASAPEELDAVRTLLRAFTAWHRELHRDDLHLIDRYFDAAAYDAELAGLPGAYAPPEGRLLLALRGSLPVGCVALKRIDARDCEMKRMFLPPAYHGLGIGRALGEAIVAEARAIGYQRMLLDTSFRQASAIALYEKLGFRRVVPYYELPEELIAWLVFMEKEL